MHLNRYMWINTSESIHLNRYIWINASESIHVNQYIWINASESIHLNQYIWIDTSESIHLNQYIWIDTCESIHLNRYIWIDTSESMHLNRYMWINTSESMHLNRYIWINTSESMHLNRYIWINTSESIHLKSISSESIHLYICMHGIINTCVYRNNLYTSELMSSLIDIWYCLYQGTFASSESASMYYLYTRDIDIIRYGNRYIWYHIIWVLMYSSVLSIHLNHGTICINRYCRYYRYLLDYL